MQTIGLTHKKTSNTTAHHIVESLQEFATKHPQFPLYTFLGDTISVLTPHELDIKARAIAAFLESKSLEQKSVVLLFEPGLEYISALFGCLYANVIAIPAYPPMNEDMAQHLIQIMENSKTQLVLSSNKVISQLKLIKVLSPMVKLIKPLMSSHFKTYHHRLNVTKYLNKIEMLNIDDIPNGFEQYYKPKKIHKHDIAYLQYTSGSTSEPKGVIIRHENLIINLEQLNNTFHFTSNDCIVTWLPPYHDMGLITGIFMPLLYQFKSVHMSPFDFLQKPIRWLQAMSDFEATIAGGPDFCYKLCIDRVSKDHLDNLNFKKLRVMFSGSEKVHHDTYEKFYTYFKSTGLHHHIFSICYGLAEAVVFVSSFPPNSGNYTHSFDKAALANGQIIPVPENSAQARKILSTGFLAMQCEIKIVNPETREELGEDKVGELWINGPNIATGYWNNPAATHVTLHATLAVDNGKKYLRTGDLGFLHRNEIFITGRIKDLIIINGLNHYPQDIEASLAEVSEIRHGRAAAFSIEGETSEQLIIVTELKNSAKIDYNNIAKKIRADISKHHHIPVDKIVFVEARSIPKTTSGKIKRVECKRLYLSNQFVVLYQS